VTAQEAGLRLWREGLPVDAVSWYREVHSMPIYEYDCNDCGHEFEEFVRSQSQSISCPTCGRQNVEKKFSLFGMKSGDSFTPSQGGTQCSSCTAHSCKNCGGS